MVEPAPAHGLMRSPRRGACSASTASLIRAHTCHPALSPRPSMKSASCGIGALWDSVRIPEKKRRAGSPTPSNRSDLGGGKDQTRLRCVLPKALDQTGVFILDVADPRAHRPGDHLLGASPSMCCCPLLSSSASVTGERIRDKIAASKKRGLWMGGNPPLRYRARERTLIIRPPRPPSSPCLWRQSHSADRRILC